MSLRVVTFLPLDTDGAGFVITRLEAINQLFKFLSPNSQHPIEASDVQEVLDSGAIALGIDEGSSIVGFGLLIPVRKFAGFYAQLEDIVVHPDMRGRGVGERICRRLIEVAMAWGVNQIELTSNPRRLAARQLYEKLGFKLRETGCYRLTL